MVRWSGFAEFTFADSARLAFVRALEQVQTEADGAFPDAWVIEDRRIAFSVRAETPRPVRDGIQRLLGALVRDAATGDAEVVSEHPRERWSVRAAIDRFERVGDIAPDSSPDSLSQFDDEDTEGDRETIPTSAP
jgi:hypothetical protein